jgi:hypothetical protein
MRGRTLIMLILAPIIGPGMIYQGFYACLDASFSLFSLLKNTGKESLYEEMVQA